MTKEVIKMELGVHVQFGGFQYYEVKLFFQNEDGDLRINIIEIAAATLKKIGVINRTNGYKKIREWLKTEDAKKVMKEITDRKYEGTNPFIFK